MTITSDQLHDAAVAQLTAKGQLFELEQLQRPWGEQPIFKNAPPTMAAYFSFMLQHAEKTFLVYGQERYSFGQVWEMSNRVAAALQQDGVAKGDRVVIAMRNSPEWIFSFIGTLLMGAVAVPLNAWWRGAELLDAIEDCAPKLAFVDRDRHERLGAVEAKIRQIVVRSDDVADAATAFDAFLGNEDATPSPVDVSPDDDSVIFYTSGSTDRAKGAVSTHRALTNALVNFAVFGLAQQEVERQLAQGDASGEQPAVLLSVPLFHVTGCHAIFLMSVLIGRKIVLLDKWDAGAALALIEKERVTVFTGVPTMSRELTEHPDFDRFDTSSLKDINSGGAARPAEHVRRLLERFPDKRPGAAYGLTETNGTGAINARDGYKLRPASTGRAPKPLGELAIFDDDGAPLPDGATGEIAVRSIALARGYLNRPEETAAAFMKDGWFRTGDIGFLEDGYLTIVDRKKDMILRGGENISCQEVEAAMQADPQVLEACVFGVPEQRLGEAVRAVVYVESPDRFYEAKHREMLNAGLAKFKHPTVISVVSQPFPRLGSGKIDKLTIKSSHAR